MRRFLPVFLVVFVAFVASSAPARAAAYLTCPDLDGAAVYSDEVSPAYLGFFGSRFATDSIMNPIGPHGSTVQYYSVRNSITYGSSVNQYSANNSLTTHPPVIVRAGYVIGRLTTNSIQFPVPIGVPISAIDANCTFYSGSPDNGLPVPPAPVWVSASDGEYSDRVQVIWASVPGATAYVVGAAESPVGDAWFSPEVTGTGLAVTGLTPGRLYDFGVTAINANGHSPFTFDSGYVAISTPTNTPTNTPVPTVTSSPPATQTPQPGATPEGEKVYLPVTKK